MNFSHRYIYWNTGFRGEKIAIVHLLVGYCDRTITNFQKMADELRRTFPQAKNEDIICSQITKSFYADGHTLIEWRAEIPEGEYPGWDQSRSFPTEYIY